MDDESDEELRDWITALGVSVRKWLGWESLAGLIGWVDPMMNMMKRIWWKVQDWITAIGMLFQKWLGEADNLTENTGLAHSAWRVGSKMDWRGRLGRIDRSGGPDYKYNEMNLMKNTGLDHSDWRVILKMDWRFRLGRINGSGGHDGDREVQADWRLRAGGRNGSPTIGSWGATGGGKKFLPPIPSVMKGRGFFVSDQKNNPNRLHTNLKWNVVQDSINNTYNTIVLWLHINLNCNIVQDSINNTCDKISL